MRISDWSSDVCSSDLLNQCLAQAGVHRSDCYVTNVFNLRPARNDVESLCGPKAEGISWMPELRRGKYIRGEYEKELIRLFQERSKARRVGKGCVSTCRSRWSQYH